MVDGDAEKVARSAEKSTDPVEIVQRLGHRGLTIATGESLTAGSLASRIADVPGASVALLGGVVSYSNGVKENMLGVDAQLLETRGAVDGGVAAQMAQGAAQPAALSWESPPPVWPAPNPTRGKPVGTVYLGFYVAPGVVERFGLRIPENCSQDESAPSDGALVGFRLLDLDGDREAIRWASVEAALQLVSDLLHTEPAGLPEA